MELEGAASNRSPVVRRGRSAIRAGQEEAEQGLNVLAGDGGNGDNFGGVSAERGEMV